MAEETPTYITISDEDGKEYEMEVVARFEYLENEYMALIPASEEDDNADNPEVNILRITEEDGDEVLDAIENEEELNGAYDALMELIMDDEED